jgi:hypothetical protein
MIVGEILENAKLSTSKPTIREPFASTVKMDAVGEIAAYLIAVQAERAGYRALLDAMEARVDKQVGASPNSSGSTSLAMKGLVPEILGVAVERGALNREVKGTTVTFRATPAGVVKALQGQGLLDMYADYSRSPALRVASRFSAAASFDTSRGSAAGTFTADSQQLAGWSVRAAAINQRDPASPPYRALWTSLARDSRAYDSAVDALRAALPGWTAFVSWNASLVTKVTDTVDTPWKTDHDTAAAMGRFKALLEAEFAGLEKLPNTPPTVTSALDAYVAGLTEVQAAIDSIYDFAGKGMLLTLDWSTARDATLPDLYTVTGVWEAGVGASRRTDVTVNGAANFYRSKPQSVSHQFKNFDLTMQVDHPLGRILALPAVTLTVSARYSYLPRDTVAPALAATATTAASPAAAVAPQGSIGVIQAKLTIPVKGTGMKIPLSITASNRTELIKEKDVRASFGFTLDLDALVGGLRESKR